jgi:hypothetical protein
LLSTRDTVAGETSNRNAMARTLGTITPSKMPHPPADPNPFIRARRTIRLNPRNCFRNSTKKAREVKASRAMDDLPRTPGWVKPCDGGGST